MAKRTAKTEKKQEVEQLNFYQRMVAETGDSTLSALFPSIFPKIR